jgi:four helix bundle protein
MRNFKQLKVWSKAHELTLAIYQATSDFPKDELYGLTSQIRRACTSIPSNIAEGCDRGSNADMIRFLYITSGSASELEYQLLLASDLELLDQANYQRLASEVIEVKRMLTSLIQRLKLTADS